MKQKKATSLIKKGKDIRQIAALPYRISDRGELKVLLITSRGTRRFVIPKGWQMDGLKDWEAAAQEAREEAGIKGEIHKQPIGEYQYWKRLKSAFVPITVAVYPLKVTGSMPRWREAKQRRRGWVDWEHAKVLVDEPELVTLIDAFALAHIV
ncbi:MAG: NUDIX hydrolase [Rhizobiaceae bacterium]|nr:NUDIX hydrolase [Rhizobiaceae bacterium]